jgi:hypothetical protein
MPRRPRRKRQPVETFASKEQRLIRAVTEAAIAWHEAMPGSREWEVATQRLAKATIKLRAWRMANEPVSAQAKVA